MAPIKLLVAFFFLVHCLAAVSLAAEPADSLAYEAQRRHILENAPDERATLILGAAQELARDGYYAEALDLIYSMRNNPAETDYEKDFDSVLSAGTDSGASRFPTLPRANTAPPPAYGSGYVQSTVDYEEWEHLDTLIGGRIRAKLEWDPKGRLIDRIATVFQGSDRNAYFDLSGKGSAFGGLLKLEGDGLVEKKLWQTYNDSLDRVFLQARVEGNTRRFGKPVSVVAPAYAETEMYRYDRAGSLSYRALGAAPGLEAVSDNLLKSLILSWDLRRTDYPSSPASSNFRNGPVASGEWYGERITFDAESRFITYAYDRDTSLTRISQLETRAGVFLRALRWLKLGVRTVGESETDDYKDSVDFINLDRIEADYKLEGSSWSVEPQLVAEWASAYSASLGLGFARGTYPTVNDIDGRVLLFPLYQNYSADDWKAEAGFSILSKAIFLTMSLDYEENWVANPQIYRQGSSKGLGLNSNLFWKIRNWI